MASCNFCDKKITDVESLSLPFTCTKCVENQNNYAKTENEEIIYIDSNENPFVINSDTELNIVRENPIDSIDFKDSLLASLYSQVEFLRNELLEKNLLIRALVIRCGENDTHENELCGNVSCRNDNSPQSNSEICEVTEINDISEITSVSNEETGYNSFPSSPESHEYGEINANLHPVSESAQEEEDETIFISLNRQLQEIRTIRHLEYVNMNNIENEKSTQYNSKHLYDTEDTLVKRKLNNNINDKSPWANGTVLVIGDSTLNGIQESKMGPRFKVRAFPGAIIRDLYHYSIPLLEKNPSFVIVMAGTNDSVIKSSECILFELLQLKKFIADSLPGCEVIISCPTDRYDEPKAKLTLLNLRRKLNTLKIPVIVNDNLNDEHIGKRGLHLNNRGAGRLAVNFMSYMRQH